MMGSNETRKSALNQGRWVIPLILIWLLFAQGAPIPELSAYSNCELWLVDTQITDSGDGDGFADTNETLRIGVSLQPNCKGVPSAELNDCVAWLSTESAAIDCMRRPEIFIGDLPVFGPAVTSTETFEVRIGSIDRTDLGLTPDDPLEATLMMDIRCVDEGHETRWFQDSMTLQLDLNVSGLGQTPVDWVEDFEAGGTNPSNPMLGTAFEAQNNDEGIPGANDAEGLQNAQGWRCQYNDPDWVNGSAYNHEAGIDCYPGLTLAHANAVFWQVDGSGVAGTPDGGRAYRGTKSMYYGIFLGDADENFTTPLGTVEAAGTTGFINLGTNSPVLSYWQQISLADNRIYNTAPFESVDRGVAQIKLYNDGGTQISPWMSIRPLQNFYDQQAFRNYFNCTFDPIDDGNTEDDFFDPTDPDRDEGPSSTCFPAPSYADMGSTTGVFSVTNVGHATTPPASSDEPTLGVGTWVQSKVDLSQFRGRRAKLRFLVGSLKAGGETHVALWGEDLDEREDGWWIDEIAIDETLTEPAVFTNDQFLLGSCSGEGEPCIGQCSSSLAPCSSTLPCTEGEGDCVAPCPPGGICSGPPPDCGTNCTQAEANVFVEPDGPLNPDQVTTNEPGEQVPVNLGAFPDPETGAQPSWVDVCIDGHKEYRACISGDPDGDLPGLPDTDCDDAWDSFDCEACSPDWSSNATLSATPEVVTTYAFELRCSTAPDCRGGRTLEIVVNCPNGDPNTLGLREMRALDREALTWRGPLDVDWLRGSFSTASEIGDYVADFFDFALAVTSIPMNGDPPTGSGYYYLVKKDGPTIRPPLSVYNCRTVTWRSGGDAEVDEFARNDAFGDP